MLNKVLTFIFLSITILGCVQPTVTNVQDNEEQNSNNNSTQTPVEVNITMSWRSGSNLFKTLELAPNNDTYAYVFGDDVQNYLLSEENFNSSFCLVTTYQFSDSSQKELRLRAVASFTTNYSTGQKDYYFRINTAGDSGNDFCNKQTMIPGDVTTTPPPASIAYHTSQLCPTCSGSLFPISVKFYKYIDSSNTLLQIEDSTLKSNDLKIQINYASSGSNTGGGSSCTDSSCNTQGFDCCIASQCVNNKALRKDPADMTASELAEYNLAQAQQASDPNWYLQYPNLYYICPNSIDNSGNDDGDDDNTDQAADQLAQNVLDFHCITEMKDNATETPFHEFPVNTAHTYLKCNTTDSQNNMYYTEVLNRLYANCGCDAQYTTLEEKVENCPNYDYQANYENDAFGNPTSTITSLTCSILSTGDEPFGTKFVQVNNKSAPHRFFNTDGEEIDLDDTPITITNQNQEGLPFIYLDNDNIFPQNGAFNMNSILGRMYVDLDLAKPAKKIDVDFDKQYYINALNGYYTPCPNCAKDPWFSNFSAHPISDQGIGLQSVGYTTDRKSFGTNTTLGNYSDTHFARACFVPPTMLPFSHSSNTDSQQQRLNRLEAQSALYVNGYQKDWFGFNKGALIGSFDGVTWFAIGAGRIVRSTSKHLYLAINAPYADLATTGSHNVSIQEWDGITTAPQVDFDPSKTLDNPFQNFGATCQDNYQCEADSDCITKLGWEYTCQDVATYKTKWPSFSTTTAAETANLERDGSISDFLQQAQMPSGSTKRCVYKGSGSVCRTDSHNITDEELRKKLTCAPNFYCANLNSAGVFNKEVARFGAPLSNIVEANNHMYGKDANILGRPKHYIASGQGSSLSSTVITAITKSVLLMDSNATGKVGLCLPGKSLTKPNSVGTPTNYLPKDQHQVMDTDKRTDYISQIGGCNSKFVNDFKYSSCPLLDDEGNYIPTQNYFVNSTDTNYINSLLSSKARSQNSCGLESLNGNVVTSGADELINAESNNNFSAIEGKNLDQATVTAETLVQNACLRRAGAVCHTNLDCSPNSMHAEVVSVLDPSFFGNEAEKNYWSESLVCGQGPKEPTNADSNYATYDITNNRCCREIGSTLTIYSERDAADTDSPDVSARTLASTNPSAANRYSRFSILPAIGDTELSLGGEITQYATPTGNTDLTNPSNILVPNQWKAIDQVASKTCCGGGWIRKFADGTNNWTLNRLNLDISKFSCLNSKTPLTHVTELTASEFDNDPFFFNVLQSDLASYCHDSDRATGSCSDQAFGALSGTSITPPSLNSVTDPMRVYTLNTSDNGYWEDADHDYSFFPPKSTEANTLTYLDWNNFDAANPTAVRRNISIQIPSYIPLNLANPSSDFATTNLSQTISSVRLGKDGDTVCTALDYVAGWYGMNTYQDQPVWAPDPAFCGYTIDRLTRTMKISLRNGMDAEGFNASDDIYYAQIQFTAPGTQRWETARALTANTVDTHLEHRRGSTPGNALYYLQKLAKLELIGIPQVTFEPIYCNNNYQKLVPGIFDDSIQSINDIRNNSNFFEHTDSSKKPWNSLSTTAQEESDLNRPYVTTQKMLEHSPVFSSEEMMCCTPLGKEASASSQCCSGRAVLNSDDNKLYCKIPSGVNLNVYFNKFVSNEGTDPDNGSAHLEVDDFDEETGFPILSESVLQKINQLGSDFCESATVVRGGAFGEFRPQPVPPGQGAQGQNPIFNIVDSFSDNSTNNTEARGAIPFTEGKRWNHHIYCAD